MASAAVFNITEPDEGEEVNTLVCFEAMVDIPRRRDAVFQFAISNLTTFTSVNFSANLMIPMDFVGLFNSCLNLTLVGDSIVESNTAFTVEVLPLSDRDTVQFPQGADSLIFNVFDNDGMIIDHC